MVNSHPNLIRALHYLQDVVNGRLEHHFSGAKKHKNPFALPEFSLEPSEDFFTAFIAHSELSIEEFIVLLSALVPHVVPNFFERIISSHLSEDGDFPEFGGYRGGQTRYMIPTVGTALFILAGDDVTRRMELMGIFDAAHFFEKSQIVRVDEVDYGEPFLSRRLLLDEDYVQLFTQNRVSIPALSTAFPAKVLDTEMEWEDLVLNRATLKQLKEIEMWLSYNEDVMHDWGLGQKVKPGYRALFYGPPGTGKTLAATLIGKAANRPVFRVDLSKVVSKYIGETEKNLANLFDKAENKDWILFFDEADACFGKRSSTKDAKDRYANQEIAYLLQRIENYNGLVILATNFKNNVDDAFLRRFNSVIYFPKPKPDERLLLWQKAIPKALSLDVDVDLNSIANRYELTGSHIIGAVHHACLKTRAIDSETLSSDFLINGISKELAKEGIKL